MVPTAGVSAAPGRGVGVVRSRFSLRTASSPTKLRAATVVTVVLALVLSLGGWYSVQRRSTAIDDAAAAAQQLIRVQDVRVLVVEADSLASRAYLQGGQEVAAERQAYEDSAANASNGLVDAATAATTVDAQLLESANAQLARYLGLVEQARANNRQGFPVGAAYLRQAHTVSVAIVSALREVEAHARQRVDDSIARAHRSSWLLVLGTMLVLAAIVVGGVWVTIRWRRLINVPLAAAGLLAFVVLTAGVGVNAGAMNDADAVVEQPLSSADVLAQARAAAFDARSNEALTLIYRGNGQAFASQWEISSSIVDAALDESCGAYDVGCDASEPFAAYSRGYEAVRKLDDEEGDWEAARDLSTTGTTTADTGSADNPVASFEAFASTSGDAISAQSAAAARGFENAVDGLGVLAFLIVIAGLAIAVLAVLGYGQRVREYR